ncbi:MAG: DUF1735 domain-containing protein, partial [Candidatus Cryptobacteroides sp.]
MKTIYRYLLAALGMLALSACSNTLDYSDLIPDDYRKIVYFKNSGWVDLELFARSEYEHTLMVVKAGGDPSLEAECSIEVLSQPELTSNYGEADNRNYRVLPSGTYQLPERNFSIPAGEFYTTAKVSINPAKILQLQELQPDAEFVLPLRLVSGTDSVNVNSNTMLFRVNEISTPVLKFGTERLSTFVDENRVVSLSVGFDGVSKNFWDFTCHVQQAENAAQLASDFSAQEGVEYTLLPTDNWYLSKNGELEFSSDDETSFKSMTLSIYKEGLADDVNYVLPLEIDCQNDEFDLADKPLFVTVSSGELSDGQKIALRADMLYSPFTEDRKENNPEANKLANMLDGDPSTVWHTSFGWDKGSRIEWRTEEGTGPAEGYYFDITLDNPLAAFKFSYTTRQAKTTTGAGIPCAIRIYTRVDENAQWELVTGGEITCDNKDIPEYANTDNHSLPYACETTFASPVFAPEKQCKQIRLLVTRSFYAGNGAAWDQPVGYLRPGSIYE